MIDALRKKMILICCSAVLVVFALSFGAISIISHQQLSRNMDMMTDRISEGNGVFRPFDQNNPKPPGMDRYPDFFTEETPFSTRFFTVWLAEDGKIIGANLESVSSVSKEDAYEYAQAVIHDGDTRGWMGRYRY